MTSAMKILAPKVPEIAINDRSRVAKSKVMEFLEYFSAVVFRRVGDVCLSSSIADDIACIMLQFSEHVFDGKTGSGP